MFRLVLIISLTAMVFASSGAKKLFAGPMEGSAVLSAVSMHVEAQTAAAHDCCDEAAEEQQATGDKCHQTVAVLSSAPLVKDSWSKSQSMQVDSDRLTGFPSKLLKRPPRHIS